MADRQTAEEKLLATRQAAMEQERLRALGQMASGIAHDINNAISPIALHTELLLESEDLSAGRGGTCKPLSVRSKMWLRRSPVCVSFIASVNPARRSSSCD